MKKSNIGDLVAANMASYMKSDEYNMLFGSKKVSKASMGDGSFEEDNDDSIEIDGDLDTTEVDPAGLDEMVESYMETALWSTTGHDERSLDETYYVDDIDEATQRQMREDCKDFLAACQDLIDGQFARAGHDFWLTREGHGAGFWDGDWKEGDRLTEVSKQFGSFDLYEDGDGNICSSYSGNSDAKNDDGLDEDEVLKESSKLLNQLILTSKRLDKAGFSKSSELVLEAAENVVSRLHKTARNATDVIGFADTDIGEIFCVDCYRNYGNKTSVHPIFADNEFSSEEHCSECHEPLSENYSGQNDNSEEFDEHIEDSDGTVDEMLLELDGE